MKEDYAENFELNFKSCIYSNRLLEKLILINTEKPLEHKVSIPEVRKAIYYAKKYHGNQRRESGEPYYTHPLEVAYMVSEYLFRTDIIVTAILHDTIEDTELTYGMIKQIFGELIANQVMDLTRIKEDGHKISSSEMVKTLFRQKKYEVLTIKLFDRLHNMQTIGAKSSLKIKKIVEETLKYFLVVSEIIEMPELCDCLYKECRKANIDLGVIQNNLCIFDKPFVFTDPLISENKIRLRRNQFQPV